jgi:hypothetical protein
VLAGCDGLPSDAQARAAWRRRLNRRAVALVLIVESRDGVVAVGPGGEPPPVVTVDLELVLDDLARAAKLDALGVRQALAEAWRRARGSGRLSGVHNQGLFSVHYLARRLPRYAEWPDVGTLGRAAVDEKGVRARFEALGFAVDERGEGVYLLRSGHRPVAAALVYPPGRDLDRTGEGGQLPVAVLLDELDRAGLRWGILAGGDIWRLYDVEHAGRATSFLELDLAKLREPAYLGALFSGRALNRGGVAERVSSGSRAFGAELGDGLRQRIYNEVVPGLANALAEAAKDKGIAVDGREGLADVYGATLTLLYRLLFVLYAEARNYLPVSTSPGYEAHSLRRRLEGVVDRVKSGGAFDATAKDVWRDLRTTFAAVDHGQSEWGVPRYNGGLFHDDLGTNAGRILAAVEPTNAALGPSLYRLAVDRDTADAGPIDYADLDIRRLGDIYEGLLQFELGRAAEPLTYDPNLDAYVPGPEDVEPDVPVGRIFVRTRSGGRKASGSFYTPQELVRHVVSEALVPALEEHLEEVTALTAAGAEEAAARKLFEFRVCDPAMGSGHFLVDALDVITDRIAAYLTRHPLAPVRRMLDELRETVVAEAGTLPPETLDALRDVDLLKRVVLKRCLYGVDANAGAVELAKLALWLDAFVPGLPLSYLDHNLKHGNSLIGVVGTEVLEALRPRQGTIEGDWIAESLRLAGERARASVEQLELCLEDVKRAEAAEEERAAAVQDVASLYHRWTSESFGLDGARQRIAERESADTDAAAPIAAKHSFFHWPLEFPHIFDRVRPGFDVVLANPPWEKIKPERHNVYALYHPGLKGVKKAAERDAIMEELDAAGSPAAEDYATAVEAYEGVRRAFSKGGDYRLSGSGDLDLFKAFAERFLHIVRSGGQVGCILPRQLLSGVGSRELRAAYLRDCRVRAIDVLENKNRWAFENVHGQYTMVLFAARRVKAGFEATVPVAGPLRSRAELAAAPEARISWSLDQLARWSDTLDVPLFGSAGMGPVFAKMMRHRRFGEDAPGSWRALPYAELHGTADRPGLFETESFEGAWEVWKGANFDRYRPDLAEPAFWVSPSKLLDRLQEKRLKARTVWRDFSTAELRDRATLPVHGARIAFRDVTRATDSRTMRACLIPPRTACIHKAPTLVWPRGDARDQAWLLGVFNSLPFDWAARRRVETTMAFAILNGLPVPHPSRHDPVWTRVVELASRLSCVDERYTDFARATGVQVASLTPEQRHDAEAEIDALVAHAYGLDERDLEVVFDDFTTKAVPEEYRERVLAHYRRALPVLREAA